MSTCQVLARWPAHHPTEIWAPRPELEAVFAELAAGPAWLPSEPDMDPESGAALAAGRAEGLQVWINPNGTAWPDRVPFLLGHAGEPLVELQVDRLGDTFEAFGEIDVATAERLAGIPFVSPHLRYDSARIVDSPGLRFVEVTRSTLLELSAVTHPGLDGTTLMVGNPGSKWIPEATIERFARVQGPNFLRMAFPGRVEVF